MENTHKFLRAGAVAHSHHPEQWIPQKSYLGVFLQRSWVKWANSPPGLLWMRFFFTERRRHTLFKLKENLPFCLRVSADIWNSTGKKKKKKGGGESVLKTICTFCSLLRERIFLQQKYLSASVKYFSGRPGGIQGFLKVRTTLTHTFRVPVVPIWLKIFIP